MRKERQISYYNQQQYYSYVTNGCVAIKNLAIVIYLLASIKTKEHKLTAIQVEVPAAVAAAVAAAAAAARSEAEILLRCVALLGPGVAPHPLALLDTDTLSTL